MRKFTLLPDSAGVYKITFAPNNQCYIGGAANLRKRWNHHRCHLRKNAHYNKTLQLLWNEHSEDLFAFEIIELVEDRSMLTAREQYYLDTLKPTLNICPIAGKTRQGVKQSPEHIAKRVNALRNNGTYNVSEVTREKMRSRIYTQELRDRMSEGQKRRFSNPEERKKISDTKLKITGLNNA